MVLVYKTIWDYAYTVLGDVDGPLDLSMTSETDQTGGELTPPSAMSSGSVLEGCWTVHEISETARSKRLSNRFLDHHVSVLED